MDVTFYSNNLFIYIPFCCASKCEETNFKKKIYETLALINQTKIGHDLLNNIAAGTHKVGITTHLLQNDCEQAKKTGDFFYTKACDKLSASDPSRGTASTIVIDPQFETHMPRICTKYHYRFCISQGLISNRCGEHGSKCNRVANFLDILFHELVHAEHNQKGINKRDYFINVPAIYINAEEFNAIELENAFMIQRKEVKKSTKTAIQLEEMKRYGFISPDHPDHQEIQREVSERMTSLHNRVSSVALTAIYHLRSIESLNEESLYVTEDLLIMNENKTPLLSIPIPYDFYSPPGYDPACPTVNLDQQRRLNRERSERMTSLNSRVSRAVLQLFIT